MRQRGAQAPRRDSPADAQARNVDNERGEAVRTAVRSPGRVSETVGPKDKMAAEERSCGRRSDSQSTPWLRQVRSGLAHSPWTATMLRIRLISTKETKRGVGLLCGRRAGQRCVMDVEAVGA